MSPEAKYLTRSELCARLNVSRATSYRLQNDGYIKPPVRVGRGIMRFPLAEVEELERRLAEDRGIRTSGVA